MPDTTKHHLTHASWLRTVGRPDDDLAAAAGAEPAGAERFWTSDATTSWPHRLRVRRTSSYVRHAGGARLAG